MRDPERIERIGGKLIAVWKKYPDWRLGQLVSNMMRPGVQDVFFPEDDEWERRLDSEIGYDKSEFEKYLAEEEKHRCPDCGYDMLGIMHGIFHDAVMSRKLPRSTKRKVRAAQKWIGRRKREAGHSR